MTPMEQAIWAATFAAERLRAVDRAFADRIADPVPGASLRDLFVRAAADAAGEAFRAVEDLRALAEDLETADPDRRPGSLSDAVVEQVRQAVGA
jgi:hypothetical protein